jgi:hypothetical protein
MSSNLARNMKETFTTTFILLTILLAAQNFPKQNLVLWLDAQNGALNRDSLPAANGDSIYWWLDKSGLGNHAKTEVSTMYLMPPVLKLDSLNGRPGIRFFRDFNSTLYSTGLQCSNHPSLNPSELSIFVVGSFGTDSRNYETFLMKTPTGSWTGGGYGISEYYNGSMSGWVNNYAANLVECSSTNRKPELYVMRYKKDSLRFKNVEMGCDSFFAVADTLVHSNKSLLIGTGQLGYPLEGFIGEILMFNKYLTGNDYKQVEVYLRNKYKILPETNISALHHPENVLGALSVFPNPVNEIVTIDVSDESLMGNKKVLIFKVDGSLCFERTMREHEKRTDIPTSNLENGMYFVKVVSDNRQRLLKFIVQH